MILGGDKLVKKKKKFYKSYKFIFILVAIISIKIVNYKIPIFSASSKVEIEEPKYINCITVTDDSFLFNSGDVIVERDLDSYELKNLYSGHSESINDIVVYKDYVFSASDDKTIKVWDLKKGTIKETLEEHDSEVLKITAIDEKLVSCSSSGEIKIWDINSLKLLNSSKNTTLSNYHTAFLSVYKDRILSGFGLTTVNVLDINNAEILYDIKRKASKTQSYCGGIYKDKIVTTSKKSIEVSDYEKGEYLYSLEGMFFGLLNNLDEHNQRITCLDVNNGKVISGSEDSNIKVWDLDSGDLIRTLKGHSNTVKCLDMNDEYIVSASSDEIKIWKMPK
jgi:WD40 repeat protein